MIHPLSENLALLLPQSGLLSSVLVEKKKKKKGLLTDGSGPQA